MAIRRSASPATDLFRDVLKDPYADTFDEAGALFTYAYRAGPIDQPDNRALRAAYELQTPLVCFRGLAPGQYLVVAPMFVTADDPAARAPGLPVADMQPGGLVSGPDMRAYATREARVRLHQQRFKLDAMRAYRHRCAIHHLAFDRNVLGIDPEGVVHIARRLLDETDGPMLRTGLQGFHGEAIALPRQPQDRPDPARLLARFERFERAAA
jgi:putative restriction endonuclease